MLAMAHEASGSAHDPNPTDTNLPPLSWKECDLGITGEYCLQVDRTQIHLQGNSTGSNVEVSRRQQHVKGLMYYIYPVKRPLLLQQKLHHARGSSPCRLLLSRLR